MERTLSKTTRQSLGLGAAYVALWLGFRIFDASDPWVRGICQPWILAPVVAWVACIPQLLARSRPSSIAEQRWWDIPSLNRAAALWLSILALYILPYTLLQYFPFKHTPTFHEPSQLIETPLLLALMSLATPSKRAISGTISRGEQRLNRAGTWFQLAVAICVSVFLLIAIGACTEPAKDGGSNIRFAVLFGLFLAATIFMAVQSIRSLRAPRATGADELVSQ